MIHVLLSTLWPSKYEWTRHSSHSVMTSRGELAAIARHFSGGYGARTHGVYQHLTLNGILFIVFPDTCRCRLQLCDDAGQADAVSMTMLHAILRQCRLKSMRSVWPCFTSFAREMPSNADAVRFGRQCFPRSRGKCRVMPMPSNADAVRFGRQCFPRSRGKCRVMPMLSASADNASLVHEGNAG